MFNLIYKEIRLSAHPNLFIFTLLGMLVIVPAYQYGMVYIFGCLGPYISMMYGRETNDIYYTALLPVTKSDIVKAKCLVFALSQMAQILVSLPFAILRVYVSPDGNHAGIEANIAYYGFGFAIYAVFNLIFLTSFFRTSYKAGKAFLLAIIPAILCMIFMEVIVHLPNFKWLDSMKTDDLMKQLPILGLGIFLYTMAMLLAYRISAKRFLKVDL